ncbi:nitroreductase family protein [Streptomyces sp. TRM66268-LWL]|uniref:Nitroreductase family protein n=1 Tax=Streptomyces polyasparticus TaxID=2767826 RepID=A0ABR7SMW7_9ACTN|nr:nitroreductase family protein [Streptomyces polyasparticus]MBC9715917.1 nitroreductase family protein [Streptomyces polyasparticus]
MTTPHTAPDELYAARHVVRAAVTAPSLHNTQPWIFLCRGGEISLYADTTRHLTATDPQGRELVVSCGAALFNLRLAMRQLGFQPVVQPCPDPRVPALLARVTWGARARISPAEELMYRSLRRRHTHRGPFRPTPLPAPLLESLARHARLEGAEFSALTTRREERRLARLVQEAETLQRADLAHRVELARWTRPFGTEDGDGVPAGAAPLHPDATLLAGRDFVGWTHGGTSGGPPERRAGDTGRMALINTPQDTPRDWLLAGQALQRVLLYAAAHQVAAGFHTQPLEIPYLRGEVRELVASGQVPQMILRLGSAPWTLRTPRRRVGQVLWCPQTPA